MKAKTYTYFVSYVCTVDGIRGFGSNTITSNKLWNCIDDIRYIEDLLTDFQRKSFPNSDCHAVILNYKLMQVELLEED